MPERPPLICLEPEAAKARLEERVGPWDEADQAVVDSLIEALDGWALGLDLLAARWDLLGPHGLADRQAEWPTLLVDPAHIPSEHNNLGAALSAATSGLAPATTTALGRLVAVRGAFSVDDASALLGHDSLDAVAELRDRGLVRVVGAGRLRMFRPLRLVIGEATTTGWLAWVLQTAGDRSPADLDAALETGLAEASLSAAQAEALLAGLRRHAPSTRRLLTLCTRAVAALGPTATLLSLSARLLLLQGQLEAARESVAAALPLAETLETRAVVHQDRGAIGTELCDRAMALDGFTRAAALWREADDPVRAAVARGELGQIYLHFGEHRAAAEELEGALAELEAAGRPYLHAHMLVARALLAFDAGRPEDAALDLDEAESVLAQHPHPYGAAFLHGTRGLLQLLSERPLAARTSLEDAVALSEEGGFALLELRQRMRLAGTLSWLGEHRAARVQLRAARRLLVRGADCTAPGVFELYSALVSVCAGDTADAVPRLRTAAEHVRPQAALSLDEEARWVRALVERRLPALDVAVLQLAPDGARCRCPDGTEIDLARFGAARRILVALARAWATGSEGLDKEALFASGWPGVHIAAGSADTRLRTELSRLRRLGLRPHLQKVDGHYRLDPELVIVRS